MNNKRANTSSCYQCIYWLPCSSSLLDPEEFTCKVVDKEQGEYIERSERFNGVCLSFVHRNIRLDDSEYKENDMKGVTNG